MGDGDGARYPGAHEVVNRGVRVPRPRLEAPAPATAPQDLVPNTTTGRADTHETDRPSCAAQCERKTSSESLTRAGRQTDREVVGGFVSRVHGDESSKRYAGLGRVHASCTVPYWGRRCSTAYHIFFFFTADGRCRGSRQMLHGGRARCSALPAWTLIILRAARNLRRKASER